MNLDELANNIRKISKEDSIQKLADNLESWKTDERNAIELGENIERFLGNTWINKQTDFDKIYGMWIEFKKSAIDGIGGMTMNERLYWFGTFDLFDNTKTESEREKIYGKLMAAK
ncbi:MULTISPECIES: hypothetical protein [Flavobacteriaceae]|uniref:Uncharacterized protein n=2 Tax=Flavobacteriaceae TaxID=49546 RepID=S7X413_9FLAO|nr:MULTISPECIES: hypothetical protein [Flavobacteriaceae]EPR73769.1 hypothetical protein ADIWIN_1231 [Winogradskyella psychrotolerans RS-3]